MDETAAADLTADVVVVGAGPAGLAAATEAAERGARVVVFDGGMRAGGQIWRHTSERRLPSLARDWLARFRASGAELVTGAPVVDIGPSLTVTAERAGERLAAHARAIVLATGARERFIPFPGWTLPHVVGIGGAQALMKSGASFVGRRVVIAGSGPLVLPVAAMLARGGARLALVAEQASSRRVLRFAAELWRSPQKLAQAIGYRVGFARARYRCGTWVTGAVGDERVREVSLTDGRTTWTEACDLLCTGFGLVPNVELARAAGCEVAEGKVVTDRWQATTRPSIYCAGEPTGIAGMESALLEGSIAGLSAVGETRAASRHLAARDRHRRFERRLEAAFAPRPELRQAVTNDTIICRCEDVARGALFSGWSTREARLHARVAMGPCQGRVCGPATEYLFGWPLPEIRAPVEPASVSTLSRPVDP